MLTFRDSRHKECHSSCDYFPELFPMICSCITCVVCVFCASALTELGLQHKHMCSCPPLFTVPVNSLFYTLYLSASTLLLRLLLAGLSSCHFNTKPVYRRRFNDRSHFVHRWGNYPVCTNAFRAWLMTFVMDKGRKTQLWWVWHLNLQSNCTPDLVSSCPVLVLDLNIEIDIKKHIYIYYTLYIYIYTYW